MTGTVFDIQKFSIHDGPGIRTTVFLKGCPLDCVWCHNPESKEAEPELSFLPDKCIGCGFCFQACPKGCHEMEGDIHIILRDRCVRCGKCTAECYSGALEMIGHKRDVDEVIDEVMRDEPFYKTSGGGMTISGGEPLAQPEFSLALLEAAKARGLHCCVETCGQGRTSDLLAFVPLVDLFLFDYKATGDALHRKLIGAGQTLILKNLAELDRAGARVILRCPLVPGLNATPEHLRAIGALADRHDCIEEVNVLAYHPMAESKSAKIGKTYDVDSDIGFVDDAVSEGWVQTISRHTRKPVKKP